MGETKMECKKCKKEVEKLVALGLCTTCYHRDWEKKSKGVCIGCGEKKPIKSKSKGLCAACLARLRRYGSVAPKERSKKGEHLCTKCNRDPIHAKGLCKVCYTKEHRRKSKVGICKECGSENRLIAKELCQTCYKVYIEEKKKAVCIGCEELKPIKAMGMCHKCYQRYLRHDDPTIERIVKKGDEPCSNCGARPVHAKHLCANCYARYIARGDPKRIKTMKIAECTKCGVTKRIRVKGLCAACYAADIRAVKFGLPENAYEVMLEEQNGACAICGGVGEYKDGVKKGDKKKMHMDHDHKTGKVRALLCQMCNQGLGSFKDSPELLTNAIDYLKAHASSEA
jgi:hypothetical protein